MAKVEPFEKFTRKYEEWFERNHYAYLSELDAVKKQFPAEGKTIEIGVGTGRFAVPLGIEYGVEPSRKMQAVAKEKGIKTVAGTGEEIPFKDNEFDALLMVTTVCFLDDINTAFGEVYRVLKNGGCFVIGFIDRESPLGRLYENHKEQNPFYKIASFYSAEEIRQFMEQNGFQRISFVQTIFSNLQDIKGIEPVKPGYGEGSFLVVRGFK